MTSQLLTEIRANEFRSLREVRIPLASLSVLVGPNGSGKTNVLNALRFLASTVRFDLQSAIAEWGGYEHVKRQNDSLGKFVSLGIEGVLTEHASLNARDEYVLRFRRNPHGTLIRDESFTFKRTGGKGRRIRISGDRAEITDEGSDAIEQRLANARTTGLATLPKLADDQGGQGIRTVAEFLSSIRVLEPDVEAARQPARMAPGGIAADAGNLASSLYNLANSDDDAFGSLVDDMRFCLEGLTSVDFQPVGGPGKAVAVVLIERGVRAPVELADASFGTVRLLALLAAIHEPDPPPFTAIEEIDHGLHPYALDVLAERLRAAAEHSQFLVASHSPTLVNRLKPDELVVCSRDPETGESVIPAVDPDEIKAALDVSGAGLGELWFAGSIDGVPGRA